MSSIQARENAKKAAVEAKLRTREVCLSTLNLALLPALGTAKFSLFWAVMIAVSTNPVDTSRLILVAGEAGEEEGGVRGEDEEPGGDDPQGGGGGEGLRGGEAAAGDDQVPGDGGEAPVDGDHAQEEVPHLFRLNKTHMEYIRTTEYHATMKIEVVN